MSKSKNMKHFFSQLFMDSAKGLSEKMGRWGQFTVWSVMYGRTNSPVLSPSAGTAFLNWCITMSLHFVVQKREIERKLYIPNTLIGAYSLEETN